MRYDVDLQAKPNQGNICLYCLKRSNQQPWSKLYCINSTQIWKGIGSKAKGILILIF